MEIKMLDLIKTNAPLHMKQTLLRMALVTALFHRSGTIAPQIKSF
jgi:hypothetical protein